MEFPHASEETMELKMCLWLLGWRNVAESVVVPTFGEGTFTLHLIHET